MDAYGYYCAIIFMMMMAAALAGTRNHFFYCFLWSSDQHNEDALHEGGQIVALSKRDFYWNSRQKWIKSAKYNR
jgi:hypothetical protein